MTAVRATTRPSVSRRPFELLDRHPRAAVAGIWGVWLAGVFVTVAIGLQTGAYWHVPGWLIQHGVWPLFTWDYNWYAGIATSGYPPGTGSGNYAFYPLWPLVLRASGPLPAVVAAGAVAWIASGLAFAGLASKRGVSWRSAAALACWPGSFTLLLGYPDSLAIAAACWAAVLVDRRRPLAAGAIGAIAALARPNGVLLALPLAWLARGRGPRAWLGAALPVGAAAGVQVFFWAKSGHPTVFFDAQKLWGRTGPSHLSAWRSVPGWLPVPGAGVLAMVLIAAAVAAVLLWRRFGPAAAVAALSLTLVPWLLGASHNDEDCFNAIRVGLALPLLFYVWRLGRSFRPWALFATAVVASLLLSGTTQSFGRQVLFAFPLFWAAGDGPAWLRHPLVAAAGFAANLALAVLIIHFPP